MHHASFYPHRLVKNTAKLLFMSYSFFIFAYHNLSETQQTINPNAYEILTKLNSNVYGNDISCCLFLAFSQCGAER